MKYFIGKYYKEIDKLLPILNFEKRNYYHSSNHNNNTILII